MTPEDKTPTAEQAANTMPLTPELSDETLDQVAGGIIIVGGRSNPPRF